MDETIKNAISTPGMGAMGVVRALMGNGPARMGSGNKKKRKPPRRKNGRRKKG